MARRDLTNFQEVGQVTPDVAQNAIGTLFEAGAEIATQAEEARMINSFSEFQIKLNELDNQIQLDYQSNPAEGKKVYLEQYEQLSKTYGENVNPFFKSKWNENILKLKTNAAVGIENWALKQGQENTKNYINSALKNTFNSAQSAGMKYGETGGNLEALLNYDSTVNALKGMASEKLGTERANQAFKTVDADYIKSFVSGVAETNPAAALQILEREDVKGKMDLNVYSNFKDAVENKVLNFDKEIKQNQIINFVKNNTDFVMDSATKPKTYLEIQDYFSKNPDTPPFVQSYILKINGFKTTEGNKVLGSEKVQAFQTLEDKVRSSQNAITPDLKTEILESVDKGLITTAQANGLLNKEFKEPKLKGSDAILQKAKIYNKITSPEYQELPTTEKSLELQNLIFEGLDNGALSKDDGINFMNDLLKPLVDNFDAKTNEVSGWRDNDKHGLKAIDAYLESVAILPNNILNQPSKMQELTNAQRKVYFYDNYYKQLDKIAQERGLDKNQINKEDYPEEIDLAFKKTKEIFLKAEFPILRNYEDLPNNIIGKDGSVTKAAEGATNVTPNRSVKTFQPNIPTILTKEEFDKLPLGSQFYAPNGELKEKR